MSTIREDSTWKKPLCGLASRAWGLESHNLKKANKKRVTEDLEARIAASAAKQQKLQEQQRQEQQQQEQKEHQHVGVSTLRGSATPYTPRFLLGLPFTTSLFNHEAATETMKDGKDENWVVAKDDENEKEE